MVHYVQHGPHKRTKYYANVIDYFRYIKILTWLQGRAVRKQKKCIILYWASRWFVLFYSLGLAAKYEF